MRELPTLPDGHPKPDARLTLHEYYNSLFCALGPQHWWPGKTKFEVIVGAILTQSTAWVNVELAIRNLRAEKMLSAVALERVRFGRLAELIRPSGYFRQKAKKLKAFAEFLRANFQGSLARMFRTSTDELRERLLGVHGIGPETADSILLYAGGRAAGVCCGCLLETDFSAARLDWGKGGLRRSSRIFRK
jgi:endonuclease-3 related protein